MVYDSPLSGRPLTRTREKCPDTLGRVDFEIEVDIPPDQLRITAVSPEAVLQGTFVTVEGRGFGDRYDEVTVHVGGREALLLSVTPTMIRFRVPHGAGELRPLRITVGTSSVEIDDLLRHAPAPDKGVVGQIGPPAAFTGTAALTGPAPVGLDQPILVIFCSPSDRAPTDGGLTAAQERQRQIDTFESLVNPAFRQMSYNTTDFAFDYTEWLELPDSDDDYFWRPADITAAQDVIDNLPVDATEERLRRPKPPWASHRTGSG